MRYGNTIYLLKVRKQQLQVLTEILRKITTVDMKYNQLFMSVTCCNGNGEGSGDGSKNRCHRSAKDVEFDQSDMVREGD